MEKKEKDYIGQSDYNTVHDVNADVRKRLKNRFL